MLLYHLLIDAAHGIIAKTILHICILAVSILVVKRLSRGIQMEFPERVFTEDEVRRARELVEKGYKHRLMITGSKQFKAEVKKALQLIETAGYYDFLRTYIREIQEIEGFSQLHEADVVIWANMQTFVDSVDAASYLVQKAHQMKDYLERRLYYGTGEISAIEKRLEFLGKLKERSSSQEIKRRCEELLKQWADTKMMFP